MIRYLFIIILQVLYFSLFAQNQQILVSGKVFDAQTKKPLSEVQVFYADNSKVVTNSNGLFEFSCDTDKIQITFILFGYQTFTKSIRVHPDNRNELSVGLEPFINELNEVVVSADKTKKRVSDLSVSLNIIKPYEITKNHIVNAQEIIKQTQGIEIIDGQASIRGGSGFSYGAGSRVLALINGLPVISADAGNIRWQFLPIENIGQIEIIKGASSVLYGSSALNGIINFISADADTVPQIKYSLTSGIYDKPKRKNWIWRNSPSTCSDASFSFSQKIKKSEIIIGSNLLNDNGYRKLNNEKLARLNFNLKQNSDKFKGLSYGIGFLGGYNDKIDFILWENAETGALIQNENTATELNALFFTFDPFISFTNSDIAKHDIHMRFQISDNKYPINSSNNSKAISNYSEYKYYRKFSNKLDVILGVSDIFSKITSELYGNHNGDNISVYSQIEYEIFTKLKLSAGIRTEYNTLDDFKNKIVPVFRSGINYKLGQATFLRASFGQGYRYPSVAEKFAYTSLGAVKIFPNSEIKPEFGWSSEIGVKQGLKFNKIIGKLDIALFYSENKDMIEYVFGLYPNPISEEFNFGFRSSNIENSKVYGCETEFLLHRNYKNIHLNIGGGYTYIYPVEINKTNNSQTNIYLKYRRKHTAKFIFNVGLKKFEIGVNAFFKSKVLNIDNVFLNPLTRENLLPGFYDYWLNNNKGYILADVFLSYRLKGSIKFSFAVKNVGNTEYMDRPGNIMAQRLYSLQLSGLF